MTKQLDPTGVIPAVLLPFSADYTIDVASFRGHLRDVATVPGVTALTVNGHSCEIESLEPDEQRRVLDIALDTVGNQMPIVCGIFSHGTLAAAKLARAAELAGAQCLLVAPPEPFGWGAQQRPEMALRHFSMIAEATSLPIIVFQYALSSGRSYPLNTLIELCTTIPNVCAIKDFVGDGKRHEEQIRTLHRLDRPIRILTTHSAWLLGSLVLGCDGLLSGAGSVIADLQVALFDAVKSDDLALARRINNRIYPLVCAFYDQPLVDMHNRMKEALHLLGRIPSPAVRPPLVKLEPAEIERIGTLLTEAELAPNTVYRFRTM